MDGTCDCGDFEGEFCQKPSSVSRQLIGRFGINLIDFLGLLYQKPGNQTKLFPNLKKFLFPGNGAYYALFLMFAMLVCLAVNFNL